MPPRYTISNTDDEDEDEDQKLSSKKQSSTDQQLEKALRDAVANIFKRGNLDDLTVKRVRLAAESDLGLEEGYFKGNERWKPKSDQIIKDEVEKQQNAHEAEQSDSGKPSSPPKRLQPTPRSKTSTKRTATESQKKASKRRKTDSLSDSNDVSSPLSELNEDDGAKDATIKKPHKKETKPKLEDSDDEKKSGNNSMLTKTAVPGTDSESEMSVVLDEERQPTRKRDKESSAKDASKVKTKTAAKADADLDPEQAEIKRLQSWLLKCGIRKFWSRELAPYETPKAKMKHLRQMLEDAGMKGRYSLEKAKQIKEERELKADLELVQEGARRWGTGGGGEESDDVQPRRRVARGLQNLAFLSDDGEETD